MNNFIFQNATKVYFGRGCVKEYLACLTKGANTILLAYGGGSIRRNGIYDEVTGILRSAGKTVVEFPGILANPTYAKVLQGAKLAREAQADMILAVGGGSVMDCCKAISLAARCDGDIWEEFWARPGVIDFAPLPLGVIVTVAGTGSECNGGAVITNEEKKVKTGRDYPQLNPAFALLDPVYTYSVPQRQMISGSFDILSHILETYFSEPDEDNVSDDIMEALMRSVIRNLRAAIRNPEDYTPAPTHVGRDHGREPHHQDGQEVRLRVPQHGAPARRVHGLQPRLRPGGAAPHLLPPHLPRGAAKVRPLCRERLGIARQGRSDEALAQAGIDALAAFIREVGLPTTLQGAGRPKGTAPGDRQSCGISQGSYKRMTHEEILAIFYECYDKEA